MFGSELIEHSSQFLFFINEQKRLILCFSWLHMMSQFESYRLSVCLPVNMSVKTRCFEAKAPGIICFYIHNDPVHYLELVIISRGLIKMIFHPRFFFVPARVGVCEYFLPGDAPPCLLICFYSWMRFWDFDRNYSSIRVTTSDLALRSSAALWTDKASAAEHCATQTSVHSHSSFHLPARLKAGQLSINGHPWGISSSCRESVMVR